MFLVSSAVASEPPTSAPGSARRTASRSAATVVKAASEAGAASSTTCHWLSPVSDTPAGVTDAIPGVAAIAACTPSVSAVRAITRVGSVNPPGKCADSVAKPVTESARTRNWSISDKPTGIPIKPVARTASATIDATATRPA